MIEISNYNAKIYFMNLLKPLQKLQLCKLKLRFASVFLVQTPSKEYLKSYFCHLIFIQVAEYRVSAEKYNVSANEYHMSAKVNNGSAKEYNVSAEQYRMLTACLGYTTDDELLRNILSTIPSGPDGSPPSNDSRQQIKSYFEEEEQRCLITEKLNGFNSTTTGRLCPCIPPTLGGSIEISYHTVAM